MGRVLNACAAVFVIGCPNFATAEITIAALGDSLTQGYGLPAEQGFVPQLETALRAKGFDVTIINAGVSGDTTQGGAARIAWTLTPQVDGVIVALGGNDVLRGLPPEVSRANLDAILQTTQDAGVSAFMIGMQAPANYGPAYKTAFDDIYPSLSAAYGTGLYPSFFAAFEGEGDVPADLAAFIQPDGLHPNAAGVEKIVQDLAPVLSAWITEVCPDGCR